MSDCFCVSEPNRTKLESKDISLSSSNYSLDAEVPADGPGLGRERVGRADQLAACRDDGLPFPDHRDDRGTKF